MAAVPFATATSVPPHSFTFAMNVPLEIQLASVLFVAGWGLVMRIIVRIVHGWRGIGMDVRRLLIWGVRGRICFMRRRGWDARDLYQRRLDDDEGVASGYLLFERFTSVSSESCPFRLGSTSIFIFRIAWEPLRCWKFQRHNRRIENR